MWEKVLERLLISVADATFWVIIILTIGVIGVLVFREVVDYLSEDVENEEKEE